MVIQGPRGEAIHGSMMIPGSEVLQPSCWFFEAIRSRASLRFLSWLECVILTVPCVGMVDGGVGAIGHHWCLAEPHHRSKA